MSAAPEAGRAAALSEQFVRVRTFTEKLCEPLEPEDYVVQSMPDASPAKWHLAHTTWFFENFVLAAYAADHRFHREEWAYLWNSYYEAVGPRHPRPKRGLLTRPPVRQVYEYRAVVGERVLALLASGALPREALDAVELGIHHEQQHQELLLTDLQHAFSENPLGPAYRPDGAPLLPSSPALPLAFREYPGGLVEIGHGPAGFAFDNEGPPHRVYLEPFALATRLVTSGEYAEFIQDGGYRKPSLWLSDGWARAEAEGWRAPLYWASPDGDEDPSRFSLYGRIAIDPAAPVCHVSYYEADAYARWAGHRLATEAEWETAAGTATPEGQFIDDGALVPLPERDPPRMFGGAWTWTASPYVAYPGYAPVEGALGEYNGKFMVNQVVLRGGSCLSSRSHLRATYRNFFPPEARWQMTGIRMAR